MTRKYINTSFFRVCLKIALCIFLILLIVGCLSCQRQPKIQRGNILPPPFDNIIPTCEHSIANVTWEYEFYESGNVTTDALYLEENVDAIYWRSCYGNYSLQMTIREFANEDDTPTCLDYILKHSQENHITSLTHITDEIPPEIENLPDDFVMYWYDEEPSYYGQLEDCQCVSSGDVGQIVWFKVGHYIAEYNMGSNFDSACDYITWLREGGEPCRSCSLDLYSAVNETILRLRSEIQ